MKRLLPVVAGSSIIAVGLVVAGPLSPPAGPVASTYKTLSEVEPRIAINSANTPGDGQCVYRITQPGSYYLTGNITGVSNKTGIMVGANRVSVDLCGFTISGCLNGVAVNGSPGECLVRNGTITSCTDRGVDFLGAEAAVVEDVRVVQCSGTGVYVGHRALVRRCSALVCGTGFGMGDDARLEDCLASGSNQEGFLSMSPGNVLVRCTATLCTSPGFAMMFAKHGVLESCIARENSGAGFQMGEGTRLSGCTAAANGGDGMELGSADAAERCMALSNGQIGMVLGYGCTVRQCVATGNAKQGIQAASAGCTIIGNQALHNGPTFAGLWVHSDGCRVEDNECVDNGYGVYVDGTNNIIARNSCRANSYGNFSVGAGNELAPVVMNPGSNNFGTATAWSNFAY